MYTPEEQEKRLEECRREDGMIDLAKFVGIDDTGFAHPFGFVDEIIDHGFFEGKGPLLAIEREKGVSDEERQRRRDAICEYAGRIKYNTAVRQLAAEREMEKAKIS